MLQIFVLSVLVVFSMGGCEQNGVPLGTPVSDAVFIPFSDGTFLFSLQIVVKVACKYD